jgi:hypothetical protein
MRKKGDRDMNGISEKEEITLSIIFDRSCARSNIKEEYSKCHHENCTCHSVWNLCRSTLNHQQKHTTNNYNFLRIL